MISSLPALLLVVFFRPAELQRRPWRPQWSGVVWRKAAQSGAERRRVAQRGAEWRREARQIISLWLGPFVWLSVLSSQGAAPVVCSDGTQSHWLPTYVVVLVLDCGIRPNAKWGPRLLKATERWLEIDIVLNVNKVGVSKASLLTSHTFCARVQGQIASAST